MTTDQEIFELEKEIWTELDYEQMGWHDSSIYGMSFLTPNDGAATHLAFDIDYIFKWVHPVHPKEIFSFWVAPCTLVFKDTFDLTMNIDSRGGIANMLDIADLFLTSKVEQEPNKWIYEWMIDLREGYIKLKSSGFNQIVRQQPIFTDGQVLTPDERNGIGFSQTPCSI